MLRRVVRNLDGILDDSDKPIPFSPKLLEQVMRHSFARIALQEAYSRAYVEGRLGN